MFSIFIAKEMHNLKHIGAFLALIFLMSHIHGTYSQRINDLTSGFTQLPFNKAHYINHSPYNLPLKERYRFINGVHTMWIFKTDKPYAPSSPTFPRSELSINGYKYSTGVWQFEAYMYVKQGTSGASLMQVFGGDPSATTLMVRVYDGNLYYYRKEIIETNIYDKWFRLNVIHDVEGNNVKVFINGSLKYNGDGRGGTIYYFKCGVYGQIGDSDYMESQWKDIKIYTKSN